MPYRLIAIDVDHTLLNEAGHITPRVRAAIATALERGVHVTLATGRRLSSAHQVAAELGLKLPIILYNGALVYDTASQSAIYEQPLPQHTAYALTEILREYCLQPFWYLSPTHDQRELIYTGPVLDDDPCSEPYRKWVGERLSRVQVYTEMRQLPAPLAIGVIGRSKPVIDLQARLCGPLACYSVATPYFSLPGQMALDIIHPECSKAVTLARFAGYYNIPMSEVMALGDGLNDLEMIGAAGLGIAMGNAIPEVQACAAAITATNDEDGVAQAIERWVL